MTSSTDMALDIVLEKLDLEIQKQELNFTFNYLIGNLESVLEDSRKLFYVENIEYNPSNTNYNITQYNKHIANAANANFIKK